MGCLGLLGSWGYLGLLGLWGSLGLLGLWKNDHEQNNASKIIWDKMIREKSGLLQDCFESDFIMVEIDPLYGF